MTTPHRRSPTKTIFLSPQDIETLPEDYLDDNGVKQTRQIVLGSINGEPFLVECNKHVKVPAEVAEALQGLLQKQAQGD